MKPFVNGKKSQFEKRQNLDGKLGPKNDDTEQDVEAEIPKEELDLKEF